MSKINYAEIRQEARYKVESIMGLFHFVGTKIDVMEKDIFKLREDKAYLEGMLIGIRKKMRDKKDYELADVIRDGLEKTGVKIQDKE